MWDWNMYVWGRKTVNKSNRKGIRVVYLAEWICELCVTMRGCKDEAVWWEKKIKQEHGEGMRDKTRV